MTNSKMEMMNVLLSFQVAPIKETVKVHNQVSILTQVSHIHIHRGKIISLTSTIYHLC